MQMKKIVSVVAAAAMSVFPSMQKALLLRVN